VAPVRRPWPHQSGRDAFKTPRRASRPPFLRPLSSSCKNTETEPPLPFFSGELKRELHRITGRQTSPLPPPHHPPSP
jgi:hypothetical protein